MIAVRAPSFLDTLMSRFLQFATISVKLRGFPRAVREPRAADRLAWLFGGSEKPTRPAPAGRGSHVQRIRIASPASHGLLLSLVALLLATAGCEVAPQFSVDDARQELATAFERDLGEVAIYEDARGAEPGEWIVDFKLDGFRPFLQGRFLRGERDWALDGVRERSRDAEGGPWTSPGSMLGMIREATIERAELSMDTIAELAEFVERHAVDNNGVYPTVTLAELESLVVRAGYTRTWRHDQDGWGHALVYHASPDGQAYIILSPGADGEWDVPTSEYFENTDQGMEAYDGVVSDPARDIIHATGAFVQRFEPEP